MKFFNTAGPVNPAKHYALAPLSRLDIDEIEMLIEQEKYFVLHAPRQTGKTSTLLVLMDYLNKQGKYNCLYCNVEAAQGARENVRRGIRAVMSEISFRARDFLKDSFPESIMREVLDLGGEDFALNELLTRWTQNSGKPLVLLIDEVDSLIGDTLISVLRQLRAGHDKRPGAFPLSIILCGVRDVRDYRIHSLREKEIITGGSAFNIKAKSLRMGNFSRDEIEELFLQHTKETGQTFIAGIIEQVWADTHGQPWLVNALAYEACFDMKSGRDRSSPITVEHMTQARENLILRRDTHLDQLVDKLKEHRVHRIVAPMLFNETMEQIIPDDIQYVIDLGLVERSDEGPRISNAIYREIIPRELTIIAQMNFEAEQRQSWYVTGAGRLDFDRLMKAFQEFFQENSESWIERFDYKEAGPQLLMQAFLQRIINSGGRIHREYGLGRRRTDLFVQWPLDKEKGFYGPVQKIVVELKILRKSLKATLNEGLEQTASYMDKCSSQEGHLIIFNRDPGVLWDNKIFNKKEQYSDREITIWGM